MWQRLRNLWDTVRSSYWFVPGIVLAVMAAAAEGLTWIDGLLLVEGKELPDWVPRLRADVAEQLLLAVANASVALATLVFSITLIVLTLTTGNYGPRLMRRFMGDTPTQVVLGLYTGTLVYCLLVLRATASTGEDRFIPHLAVSGAMAIAIIDVLMLTYFVHHMSNSIHATSMLWAVSRDLDAAIDNIFPEELGDDEREIAPAGASRPSELAAHELHAQHPGYLRSVDADGLLALTIEHNLLVRLPRIGTFVGPVPIAIVQARTKPNAALQERLRECLFVGGSPTPVQDVRYSLDRLVEMAARALSPGVNDPFTAIACLDQAERALSRLAGRRFPSAERFDDDGTLRVVSDPPGFDELLTGAIDPIRQYGGGQLLVTKRLFEVLCTIAEHARTPDRRRAVHAAAERAWQTCLKAQTDDPALPMLETLYRRAITTGGRDKKPA